TRLAQAQRDRLIAFKLQVVQNRNSDGFLGFTVREVDCGGWRKVILFGLSSSITGSEVYCHRTVRGACARDFDPGDTAGFAHAVSGRAKGEGAGIRRNYCKCGQSAADGSTV